MTLLMSLGNTNLTLGIAAGETIEQARIPIGGFTDLPKTLALLAPFLAHHPPPAACAISSVVPEKTALLTQAVLALTGLTAQVITQEQITLDCTPYETQAGIDRLICCEAAYALCGGPCLVFDLGTATTANVVDASGRFLGGAITAGVALGLEALRSGTAQLDLPDESTAPQLIGTSMATCMTTGVLLSAAGFLTYYHSEITTRLGTAPATVITGGNAPRILPHLSFSFAHRPNLLLEGILRHTKKSF